MGDRWKIGLACVISGFLCAMVVSLVAPHLWWLGALAGICGGYLSYEFRDVLRAVPLAYRIAKRGIRINWRLGLGMAAVISLASSCWIPLVALIWSLHTTEAAPLTLWASWMLLLFIFLPFFGFLRACITVPAGDNPDQRVRALIREFNPLAIYGRHLPLAVWSMVGQLAMLSRDVAMDALYFAKIFFILIHKHERVLCAVDGTIGGLIAHFSFAASAETLGVKVIVWLAGGLIGAVLGIANFEIVSRWWLGLVPARRA